MFAAFRHHHSWRLSRPTAGIRRLSSVVHIPWPLGTLLAFSVVLRSHADQAGLRARIKGCVKERRRTFPLRVHQRLPG